MAFAAGTQLGPYEILAPIGAGGMGEVYRARDTKLKRDVALKVLPDAFAGDPGRMARFQREAEVLASLNHPNIAHIYGVEDKALAMELVEGESPKGPLPFDEAWKIASQMADALAYAHEKGVVHRDLKPANVKVTPEGVVKLLDFGLAKAFSETPDTATASDPVNSPTLTMNATVAGVILGTAAYMAPEQARGKRVDKRADIWSWGVVLYELLTGERLFQGDEAADTLAQVLTKQPELEKAPPQVRKLLGRCLEKDPKQRLRDIGEARFLLDQPAPVAPAAASRSRLGVLASAVAGALFVALTVLSFIHFRETAKQERTLRYTIAPPDNSTIHSFAISPNGRYVAIAAEVNGKNQLWLHPLDALQAQMMASTEDAHFPFWSPDSRYIGFFAQGKLKKIAVSGGPAQALCDVTGVRGGSWSRDDVIIFSAAAGTDAPIQWVAAAGGVPSNLNQTRQTAPFVGFPILLPGGRRFLYEASGSTPDKSGIFLGSLDGSETRRVLADTLGFIFAPSGTGGKSGHLLFVRDNTLMAQPFDAGSAQTTGDAFPVDEGISVAGPYASVSASDDGILLYRTGGAIFNQMVWYDRSGRSLGTVGPPGPVWTPALSPDEKMIAFSRSAGANADIWLRDLAREVDLRFTSGPSTARNDAPVWSPKGDRIVFRSTRDHADIYQKALSGSSAEELISAASTNNPKFPTQWSRDGRYIFYSELNPKTNQDLWVLPVNAGGDAAVKPTAFLRTAFVETQGQLSPDGRWMAYVSDESGQREVYVRPFPSSEGPSRISTAGGEYPRWRGDGKELFFVAADGKMMSVAVNVTGGPKPVFQPGAPAPLFETHIARNTVTSAFQYDVTQGGKRFLVITAPSATPLTVVVNWTAGLRK